MEFPPLLNGMHFVVFFILIDSGNQNVFSFTMNNFSLDENQITIFRVSVKKVIWEKTKRSILGENMYYRVFPILGLVRVELSMKISEKWP